MARHARLRWCSRDHRHWGWATGIVIDRRIIGGRKASRGNGPHPLHGRVAGILPGPACYWAARPIPRDVSIGPGLARDVPPDVPALIRNEVSSAADAGEHCCYREMDLYVDRSHAARACHQHRRPRTDRARGGALEHEALNRTSPRVDPRYMSLRRGRDAFLRARQRRPSGRPRGRVLVASLATLQFDLTVRFRFSAYS